MNIVVLGPQGCGKGTQGNKLSKHLDIPHISTGAMLREYVKNGGEYAQKIRDIMDAGELIDDDFLEEILEKRLSKPDCKQGFILDGTPRDLYQAQMIDSFTNFDYVFLINISEEESFRRVSKRAQKEKREDDTPQALKERLHTYHKKTEPVIEHYKKQGILHVINGEQAVEDVFADILAVLNE